MDDEKECPDCHEVIPVMSWHECPASRPVPPWHMRKLRYPVIFMDELGTFAAARQARLQAACDAVIPPRPYCSIFGRHCKI